MLRPYLDTIMNLEQIPTPAAVLDVSRMLRNIDRMQQRMDALGVKFRPHVKTSKSWPVVQAQLDAGAQGITVSTLKEAEQFFAAGVVDILYAVSMAASKLPQALASHRRGSDAVVLRHARGRVGEDLGAVASTRFG